MERRSMGSFLAALRKANGLTQKDLAERLRVSDKSVSRWERDEGTPDLALIPVIAEIFGVTSDELLRGELRPPEPQGAGIAKMPPAEKQRQRILAVCLSNYKSKSYAAAGVAVAGLLAAAMCNAAFHRAYLGFFIGAAFFLVAAVFQFTAVNSALLAVSGGALGGAALGTYRRTVLLTAEGVAAVVLVGFAATLPLLLLGDAAIGVSSPAACALCALLAFLV